MEEAKEKSTCYEDSMVHSFNFLLDHNKQHTAILESLQKILPEQFKRIAEGKSSFDVLGVGSGGGQVDVGLLTLLQSTCPAVPITADVVEGSSMLAHNFKALVAKTANLQRIPFAWHLMRSEDYEKQVKAGGKMKKFDFIHMIHMIYYVDNLEETVRFYHSLLKENGVMLILVDEANCGYATLWKTYREIGDGALTEYCCSAEVTQLLGRLGLKHEEHVCPFTFDITECFDPSSATGAQLLNFLTAREHFHQSFTPETRAGILRLLRNQCSTQTDGRVFYNATFSCILVHA